MTPWLLVAMAVAMVTAAGAEEERTEDLRGLKSAIERLSAATAPDGKGADAYAEILHEDFSRWTMGSDVVEDKRAWVEGVREWFDDGWRVVERETRQLDVLIRGEVAHVRRVVEEGYAGPAGERSGSAAALSELWVRSADGWKLLRVDAQPLDES